MEVKAVAHPGANQEHSESWRVGSDGHHSHGMRAIVDTALAGIAFHTRDSLEDNDLLKLIDRKGLTTGIVRAILNECFTHLSDFTRKNEIPILQVLSAILQIYTKADVGKFGTDYEKKAIHDAINSLFALTEKERMPVPILAFGHQEEGMRYATWSGGFLRRTPALNYHHSVHGELGMWSVLFKVIVPGIADPAQISILLEHFLRGLEPGLEVGQIFVGEPNIRRRLNRRISPEELMEIQRALVDTGLSEATQSNMLWG